MVERLLHIVSRRVRCDHVRASESCTSGAATEPGRSVSRGFDCPKSSCSVSTLLVHRLRQAREATRGANARVASYTQSGDACRLPFRAGVFNSTPCVAVLQHIRDFGRRSAKWRGSPNRADEILVVEPDNAARYWFSSLPSGMEVFELGRRFFAGLATARGEAPPSAWGQYCRPFASQASNPSQSSSFRSPSHILAPRKRSREIRRKAVLEVVADAPNESLRRLGSDYLKAVDRYATEAPQRLDPTFVEIQNTLLVAAAGQRAET